METRKPLLPLIIGLAITLAVLWTSAHWMWGRGIENLSVDSSEELERFVSHLDSQLARYHFLPKLLATNDELAKAILDADNSARIDVINRYLEEVNDITGASDTYLMDATGLTIAASNWQSETPFIGRNFSFRPYFQQAAQGKLGRYFALGTTSNKRGYYFAYPIDHAAAIVGVLVLKMDLTGIEERWRGRETQFLVIDPNGVVFISSEPYWRFKTTRELDLETRTAIVLSRRYPDVPLTGIQEFDVQVLDPQRRLSRLVVDESGRSQHFLATDHPMPEAGWTVRVLKPTREITQDVITTLTVIFLLILLGAATVLLALQRRRRRIERERFAAESQRELEQRVRERTADLTHEIEERRRTELQLRDTQDELIQAAKLAVLGQLSASISHELNNPLAAIRAYADNARQFLQRDRRTEADGNLKRIADLTERMAKISSQLKVFSRKSSGALDTVSVKTVIQNAVDIVRPQARRNGLEIEIADMRECQVRADAIQLEQVLINLLSNALNAVEGMDSASVRVSGEHQDDSILIHVDDSGEGIAKENMGAIFDPFFTTRKSGLGLGLSISRRIMENMNGDLSATNRSQGGARFTITLPSAEQPAISELE